MMASSKSLSTLIEPLLQRPNRLASTASIAKTRYICQPCLRQQQRRSAHSKTSVSIPTPTPFVPDVATFLTLIGRGLSAQASKFPTWDSLFTQTSEQLREAGIEPARTRRYLLRWRQKFREGQYGPGGDLQHVDNGTAELRVIEVPSLQIPAGTGSKPAEEAATSAVDTYFSTTHTPGKTRLVLNVPSGVSSFQKLLKPGQTSRDLRKPRDYKLKDGHIIAGPYALPVAGGHGSVVRVKVQEGMWEDRLGKKVFGGERRRAEVLHKMGVAEHRKAIGTAR